MEQEPKIEKHTITDIYSKYKNIGELLKKAETIPDSHWKDVDEVVSALEKVENYLEENIGSED